MQLSSIFTAAVLVLGVAAKKHKYCNCHVNQKLDASLTQEVCGEYGQIYGKVEWISARGTCHSTAHGVGIDNDTWQGLCKALYGSDAPAVSGNCFKN